MAITEKILSFLPSIGNFTSSITQKIISFISQYGVNISQFQSKIISLLLLSILAYLFISVISVSKKFLKYGIIGLIIFLIASIITSF